jgi:small subunit ribosomal protein S29
VVDSEAYREKCLENLELFGRPWSASVGLTEWVVPIRHSFLDVHGPSSFNTAHQHAVNMATSMNCWKCLSRANSTPATASSRITSFTPCKSFSTTTTKLAGPAKAIKPQNTIKQSLKIKKKGREKSTGKPPASGERKALRKRIVLSNTNAIEVKDMPELNKQLVDDLLKEDNEGASATGKVVSLPGATVDSLRAIEAFKPTQGWGLFRKPALLVRRDAVNLTRSLVSAEAEKTTFKQVIDGSKGSGKSMMLLQAQATAIARGWIVLHLPEGMSFLLCWIPHSNKMYSAGTSRCRK